MTLNLNAKYIIARIDEIDEDNDFVEVAFADSEYNCQEYLVLQRQLSFDDEQDKAFGFDKIYIERNDQGCATYGEIEQFVLKNNSVEITLTPKTAEALSIDREIVVEFSVNPSVFSTLKEHVKKLFENNPSVLFEKHTF